MKQIALETGEEYGVFKFSGVFRRSDWSVAVTSSSDRLSLQVKVPRSLLTSVTFTSPHGVTPLKT
jgi:hypothetical protein